MNEIEKLYEARSEAENILNKVHTEFHQPHTSDEHRKFCLLKLQAATFNFEFCSGLVQFVMTHKNCFASKVMLKGLIHIIFEYKKLVKKHYIKTLMDLCDTKSFDSEKGKLSLLTKQYKKTINQIDQFLNLRNKATGHYDPDIARQMSLIDSINEDDCLKLLLKFKLFHKDVLDSLCRIGHRQ